MFSEWLDRIRKKQDKSTGTRGEDIAATFLKKQGYKIVEKNHHQRYGEIDIIAREGDTLVFVEVKTRRSDKYGNPLEAIDRRKQQKMSLVALGYLNNNKMMDCAARFDVVAIMLQANQAPQIELVRDAFELCCE